MYVLSGSVLEGSEVNYFLASDGIVYVELKTFAAHAVLLRHHRLHVEDQRVPTAVVFHQRALQADKGRARSSILHRTMNRQGVTAVGDFAARARQSSPSSRSSLLMVRAHSLPSPPSLCPAPTSASHISLIR